MQALQALKNTVARLRGPGGCPWDQEQTHQSLTPHLIEECAELLEALDSGDKEHVKEELGDLLLQVFLHAQIAEDDDKFTLDEVAEAINEKLIRRHPHVFGDGPKLATADSVLEQWQQIKAKEKKTTQNTVFKQEPPALASLLVAQKMCKRIRKLNLPLNEVVNLNRVEQLSEKIGEEEIGRLLFEIVALCDKKNVDVEASLRKYCLKVKATFSQYANSQ